MLLSDALELVRAALSIGDDDASMFVLLLRVEGAPANDPGYYRLALTETLRSALSQCKIIEYPTISVVRRGAATLPRLVTKQITVLASTSTTTTTTTVTDGDEQGSIERE